MQLILIELIHWIVINPMDSIIHPLNNWDHIIFFFGPPMNFISFLNKHRAIITSLFAGPQLTAIISEAIPFSLSLTACKERNKSFLHNLIAMVVWRNKVTNK